MRKRPTNFNAELARKQWDYAAEAFAELQASGNDYYRTGFFGPAQIDLCGDVSGLAVLDIGCGAGYFSRELSKRGKQLWKSLSTLIGDRSNSNGKGLSKSMVGSLPVYMHHCRTGSSGLRLQDL